MRACDYAIAPSLYISVRIRMLISAACISSPPSRNTIGNRQMYDVLIEKLEYYKT